MSASWRVGSDAGNYRARCGPAYEPGPDARDREARHGREDDRATWRELKIHRDPRAVRTMLVAFPGHLQVAGMGSISEVFDGEWPHVPHGCVAQAWSVAEVLRCWKRTAG